MKSNCPKCGRVYEVEDKLNGDWAQCECGEKFVLKEEPKTKPPLVLDPDNPDELFKPPAICSIIRAVEMLLYASAILGIIFLATGIVLYFRGVPENIDYKMMAGGFFAPFFVAILPVLFMKTMMFSIAETAYNTRMLLKKMR